MSINSKKKFDYLIRYTDIASALALIDQGALSFSLPGKWEDVNDRRLIEKYQQLQRKECKIFCLCLAECAETFHHWKVFTSGYSGVAIEFHREKLLNELPEEVFFNSMQYKNISHLKSQSFTLDQLPFLKRRAFQAEAEFRLVAKTLNKSFQISIGLNVIHRVVINPWMTPSVFESVRKVLETMAMIKGMQLDVIQSKLIDSPSWLAFTDGFQEEVKD